MDFYLLIWKDIQNVIHKNKQNTNCIEWSNFKELYVNTNIKTVCTLAYSRIEHLHVHMYVNMHMKSVCMPITVKPNSFCTLAH